MKRWMIATCLASACQVNNPQTSSTEQAITDCLPGGNFPNAKLPPMSAWNGQTPKGEKHELYIDMIDPSGSGLYLAFLVQPGLDEKTAKIKWGAYVQPKDIKHYRTTQTGLAGKIGDCCRPPPPPPGDGDDWNRRTARNLLEAAVRFALVPYHAADAADDVKWAPPIPDVPDRPDPTGPTGPGPGGPLGPLGP